MKFKRKYKNSNYFPSFLNEKKHFFVSVYCNKNKIYLIKKTIQLHLTFMYYTGQIIFKLYI